MHLVVIGLGLIGGSAALDLRRSGFAQRVTGVDRNPAHAETALRLGMVDQIETDLERALHSADLVLLCVPVDAAIELAPRLLDGLAGDQVLTDFCSTKQALAHCLQGHPRRGRYVGAHPMAGTEKSGPEAAFPGLFEGKTGILCDTESCDPDAVERVDQMLAALGMRRVYLDSRTHDERVALISHLAHVCAYALALTVLDREADGPSIQSLAGGGFASVARLAHSPASMWTPIFLSNPAPVLAALDAYRAQLDRLRDAIAAGDADGLTRKIDRANRV